MKFCTFLPGGKEFVTLSNKQLRIWKTEGLLSLRHADIKGLNIILEGQEPTGMQVGKRAASTLSVQELNMKSKSPVFHFILEIGGQMGTHDFSWNVRLS